MAVVALIPSAGAADLSPAHWPVSERAELQRRELSAFPPNAGIVKGHTSLVAGTLSPIAVHAGVEALRRGGTAADAAATVAFTQIATDLGSVVSYAGVTNLLYYEAKSHKVYALDAGWGSYAHETNAGSIPTTDVSIITGQTPTTGASGGGALGRQTLVGGFMAGIEALHHRFGRLKFADLFQPAIWYAENGVPISPVTEAWFRSRQTQLWRTPAGHRFASMPDGSLPKVGDLFRQPIWRERSKQWQRKVPPTCTPVIGRGSSSTRFVRRAGAWSLTT
ncbi:MAG: gamma-glutamyltransferase, partial [Sinobacteraceae bacterium]|nr:gamma-glutamyltransferase [Nevskiaceae bacterium]